MSPQQQVPSNGSSGMSGGSPNKSASHNSAGGKDALFDGESNASWFIKLKQSVEVALYYLFERAEKIGQEETYLVYSLIVVVLLFTIFFLKTLEFLIRIPCEIFGQMCSALERKQFSVFF